MLKVAGQVVRERPLSSQSTALVVIMQTVYMSLLWHSGGSAGGHTLREPHCCHCFDATAGMENHRLSLESPTLLTSVIC